MRPTSVYICASIVHYTHEVLPNAMTTHMCLHRTPHVTLSEFFESTPYSTAPDHKFDNQIEDQNELENPCDDTDEGCTPALAAK